MSSPACQSRDPLQSLRDRARDSFPGQIHVSWAAAAAMPGRFRVQLWVYDEEGRLETHFYAIRTSIADAANALVEELVRDGVLSPV